MLFNVHDLRIREGQRFVLNLGFGSMGHGTAAPIGARLACPDRSVVAIIGDACFAMHGMELLTAIEHDVKVVWIVENNQMHGITWHGSKLVGTGKPMEAVRNRRPVEAAAIASRLPLASDINVTGVHVDGFHTQPDDEALVDAAAVGDQYFEAVGVPIISGRGLTVDDVEQPRREDQRDTHGDERAARQPRAEDEQPEGRGRQEIGRLVREPQEHRHEDPDPRECPGEQPAVRGNHGVGRTAREGE